MTNKTPQGNEKSIKSVDFKSELLKLKRPLPQEMSYDITLEAYIDDLINLFIKLIEDRDPIKGSLEEGIIVMAQKSYVEGCHDYKMALIHAIKGESE